MSRNRRRLFRARYSKKSAGRSEEMTRSQQPHTAIEVDRPIRFFKNPKTDYRSDGDVRKFQNVPILPTLDDLRDERPFLKPNLVDGAYSDVEEYLGTQFHLLREDYVAPLRKGIQMFRQVYFSGLKMNRGTLKRIEGVNFYVDAYFDHPRRHRLPFYLVVLRLSYPDYAYNDWDRTTRLKSGCLLGISNDCFHSVIFAVVSQKQTPSLLKRGVLIVELPDGVKAPRTDEKWLIIENSSAYFEAYRHNLEVLRSLEPARFPLQQYLAKAERSVQAPSFLKPDQVLCFKPILNKEASMYGKISEWPLQEETVLNEQQFCALRSVFNQELCVIQGPPGTGKTFVALRIVEMLLLNRVSEGPILVVCYTNHALDQFLEGMLKYTDDIVRVGGSSKSEKLKEFTLNELLKGSIEDKKTLRQLEKDREECERRLNQMSGHAILSDDEITLGSKGLEDFLELNLTVIQPTPKGRASFGKPRRDANFLKDQDRGQIEKKKISSLSQRLLEEQVLQSQRSTIHKHLKGPQNECPTKAQASNVRKKMATNSALSLKERWILYRYEHWPYIRTWAANYVNKCSSFETSQGIYLSRSLTARIRTRDDLIQKASAYLKTRIAEINRCIGSLRTKARSRNRLERMADIVKSKRVLGMTTTGAAKFNFLLTAAKPEIVIVEEAAEVLESHLLASLTPSTKQLILIGDHQQLQPSTAVHRLAEEFRMEVSLFERLVKNEMSFVRLDEQHRMRNDFLCLLVPHIYKNYFSHADVNNYPDVKGIASNMFFMTHSHNEVSDPFTHSKSNTFEAEIVVRLAYHFLQNNYDQTEITILATYRGQVAAIEEEITNFCAERGFSEMQDIEEFRRGPDGKREIVISRVPVNPNLPVSPFEGMRVTTVDNYQGEENKIVIVSFVRSNDEAKIGFLSRENRVCVAMSRAKHGLYCVGNISLLSMASTLWAEISKVLTENSNIGEGVTLRCKTHNSEMIARTSADFDDWSRRGCGQICDEQLSCGHRCDKSCHSVDLTHEGQYGCDRICYRKHACGHLCLKQCREECGPCMARTTKILDCGHSIKGKCSEKAVCRALHTVKY